MSEFIDVKTPEVDCNMYQRIRYSSIKAVFDNLMFGTSILTNDKKAVYLAEDSSESIVDLVRDYAYDNGDIKNFIKLPFSQNRLHVNLYIDSWEISKICERGQCCSDIWLNGHEDSVFVEIEEEPTKILERMGGCAEYFIKVTDITDSSCGLTCYINVDSISAVWYECSREDEKYGDTYISVDGVTMRVRESYNEVLNKIKEY